MITHRGRWIVMATLGIAAMACASRVDERATASADTSPAVVAVAPAAAIPPGALAVRLERQPCYGRCPEYVVELFADGRVRYEGRKNVATLGEKTANIAAGDVTALLKQFADSGFATADSAYVDGSPNCGQYHTDGPQVILAALVGSQLKSVHIDTGCTGRPKYLTALATQVDSVARIAAWIGSGDNK